MYKNLPVVVIAGRPNTGKSTLFNRLLRKRRAITDPTPGVTRDPVEADCTIDGKTFRLVDTGGFKLADIEGIDKLVVEKTKIAVKKADLIILLLEAGEITSEDEELIDLLRPYMKKLVAAVNKTEGGRMIPDAWNALSFGFEKVLMISAEHGDNIGDLQQEIIKRLDFSEVRIEPQERNVIRIALLGKPNTGKSTLSNRLTGSASSIVSSVPGTTRDTVEGSFFWKSRDFIILDTAGIRRKSKVTEDIEYYSVNRAIKTINDADIVVLMIDAEEGLSDQDKKIAALAHDKGRGIIMALNKWDLLTDASEQGPQQKRIFKAAEEKIRFQFGQMEYAPVLPVSAKTGTGVDKILITAVKMYDQLNTQITTSQLNQALEKWLQESPPPTGPRTRFKVKYAVQKSANPVHFIIFTSRTQAVSDSYVSYLKNRIRRDLGFSMVPVLVEVKSSSNDRQNKK
ncbi:MAG: ribosome biogenesis GTPase Der [Treponema sp.]|nr:ribosome biogenesis GTPase Der [Treponema sp.]